MIAIIVIGLHACVDSNEFNVGRVLAVRRLHRAPGLHRALQDSLESPLRYTTRHTGTLGIVF